VTTEDVWLSERLGRPAYTVGASLPDGPGFFQARVPADDVARLLHLQVAGMRVVNVTLTLRRESDEVPVDGGFEVREATAGDTELLDIAERAFTRDRFHADPEIPDEVADRIKRDWVDAYLRGERGDRLLVAERDGRPAGFLAEMVRDGVSVIELIGVAPEARGSGAGAALVAATPAPSEVGTQAANVGATRFYERLGYVAARTAFDLHLHR
jgi:GNAT superfamily N-acetyltransferase